MFLKAKPSAVLLTLRQKAKPLYLSELAREAGLTYVHLTKIIPKLKEKELVKISEKGKFKMVSLTEKGEELATLLATVARFEQ